MVEPDIMSLKKAMRNQLGRYSVSAGRGGNKLLLSWLFFGRSWGSFNSVLLP